MKTQPDRVSPVIPFTFVLNENLTPSIDLKTLRKGLTKEAIELLGCLGIPAKPSIRLQRKALASQEILRMSVNGEKCHYSLETVWRIYSYISSDMYEPFQSRDAVNAKILRLNPDEAVEFFYSLFIETISRQPEKLLNREWLTRYQELIKEFLDEANLPTIEVLYKVLVNTLKLRLGIGQLELVATAIKESSNTPVPILEASERLIEGLSPPAIEIEMHEILYQEAIHTLSGNDSDIFKMMRDSLFYELGIRLPKFHLSLNNNLKPQNFRFIINHLPTSPMRGLKPGEILVNKPPEHSSLLNFGAHLTYNPVNDATVSVISINYKHQAEQAGLTTWTPLGYIILELTSQLHAWAPCLINRKMTSNMIRTLGSYFPGLVEITNKQLSYATITQVLRLLIVEGISIRNLRQILQALLDWDYILVDSSKYNVFDQRITISSPPSPEWVNDPVNLTSYVRTTLKHEISHKYTRDDALGKSTLEVYSLDNRIEKLLANQGACGSQEHMARISKRMQERILDAIRSKIEPVLTTRQPIVIRTLGEVRPYLREILAKEFPSIAVVSYSELSSELNIQPVGKIHLLAS